MKDLLKDLFSNWRTIPNLLSFIRIILIPFFGYYLLHDKLLIAAIIIAVSGLTDLFDGKIARRFNQVSNLGKILDPIADKLTIITIAIILFIKFRQADDSMIRAFSWVFLIFLLKDAVMVVGGAVMIALGIRPGAAEIYGKVATCVFYGVMILVIAFGPSVGALTSLWTMPVWLTFTLVIISVIATLVAFASYMPTVYKQLITDRKKEKQK